MFGYKKSLKTQIKSNFGKNPLTDCHKYYDATDRLDKIQRLYESMDSEDEAMFDTIDRITWDDLEMDQMFLRVNHCNSFIGEQMLFDRMHQKDRDTSSFEQRAAFLKKDEDFRTEAEYHINCLGKREESYYMYELMKDHSGLRIGNNLIFVSLQLLLIALLVIYSMTQNSNALIGLVVLIVGNIMISVNVKKKYDVYMDSLSVYLKVFQCAKWLSKQDKYKDYIPVSIRKSIAKLKGVNKILTPMVSRSEPKPLGDVTAILADYIYGVTLIDIVMFNYIMKLIDNHHDDVIRVLEFIGNVDADISIISYRESLSQWCKPEDAREGISVNALTHPLLEHPVPCDFELKNQAIITGPNASGKSTFMKALAINTIMAKSLHTCTANRFSLPDIGVMSCMSLRDDVVSGDSYYLREAKYVQRILSTIQHNSRMLIVIDEIFKGTNTAERIAASKAILDYIGKQKCFALVATHDLELAQGSHFQKYYFDTKIENKEVVFDYKIHDGISQSTNAIALLQCLNYPDTIVRAAKENINSMAI